VSPIALSRRVIQIVAFAVLGGLLVPFGAYMYQASVANAQRTNNNCPANESCPTVEPSSLFLYFEGIGWVLLLVAALLTVYVAWSTRGTRMSPA
jgi:hypothetical protein